MEFYHPEELSPSTIIRELLYKKEKIFDLCSNKAVLDVGCATGFFTELMARKAMRVIGFDISYSNIKVAQRLKRREFISFLCSGKDLRV